MIAALTKAVRLKASQTSFMMALDGSRFIESKPVPRSPFPVGLLGWSWVGPAEKRKVRG